MLEVYQSDIYNIQLKLQIMSYLIMTENIYSLISIPNFPVDYLVEYHSYEIKMSKLCCITKLDCWVQHDNINLLIATTGFNQPDDLSVYFPIIIQMGKVELFHQVLEYLMKKKNHIKNFNKLITLINTLIKKLIAKKINTKYKDKDIHFIDFLWKYNIFSKEKKSYIQYAIEYSNINVLEYFLNKFPEDFNSIDLLNNQCTYSKKKVNKLLRWIKKNKPSVFSKNQINFTISEQIRHNKLTHLKWISIHYPNYFRQYINSTMFQNDIIYFFTCNYYIDECYTLVEWLYQKNYFDFRNLKHQLNNYKYHMCIDIANMNGLFGIQTKIFIPSPILDKVMKYISFSYAAGVVIYYIFKK